LNDCEKTSNMLIPGRLTSDNQVIGLLDEYHKNTRNTEEKDEDIETSITHEKLEDSPNC